MKTKESIIEAAFSFYKKPKFVDFSMSELAAAVGVSKPAIYRHFENKEAVIDAMQEKFIELLSVRLLEIQNAAKDGKSASKIPFANMIQFFADNPEYINYFITNLASQENYAEMLKEKLNSKGIKKDDEVNSPYEKKFSCVFYCGASLLYFIKIRTKKLDEKKKNKTVKSNDKFSLNLIDFLSGGFVKFTDEENLIHPVAISKERFSELDSLCEIDGNDFQKEDRFFTAFASVLEKYGTNGITLEKIADELDMAKSSLYFYFDNKNEMIKTLIMKELSLLFEIIRENSAEAKNYSEFIYISMKTELSYFHIRPAFLPMLGWLLQSSTERIFTEEDGVNNVWEKKITKPLELVNLGFELKGEHLTFWFGMLPVALTLISQKYKIDYENQKRILKDVFDFIQFGVTENKNN